MRPGWGAVKETQGSAAELGAEMGQEQLGGLGQVERPPGIGTWHQNGTALPEWTDHYDEDG